MAITYQDGIANTYNTTGHATLNTACSPNDLISSFILLNNSSGIAYTISMSDNVNSGNYTQLWDLLLGNLQYSVFLMVANGSGTPTLTCTDFSTGGFVAAMRYNGFTGTPTLDQITTYTTGVGTSIASNALVTGQNNELVIGWTWAGEAPVSPSFTARIGSNNTYNTCGFDITAATSGTNETLSYTVSTSATWLAITLGVYGGVSPTTYPLPSQIYIMP